MRATAGVFRPRWTFSLLPMGPGRRYDLSIQPIRRTKHKAATLVHVDHSRCPEGMNSVGTLSPFSNAIDINLPAIDASEQNELNVGRGSRLHYGLRDNVDPGTSHVIPAIVRKCARAVEQGNKEILLWADGASDVRAPSGRGPGRTGHRCSRALRQGLLCQPRERHRDLDPRPCGKDRRVEGLTRRDLLGLDETQRPAAQVP